MNWQQLKALLWLHSRLYSNRLRRSGTGGVVIEAIVSLTSIIVGGVTFIVGLAVGFFALPRASATTVMLVWDGVAAAFLFMWFGELISELQRADLVGLDKFLHLPVSPSGIFLINFAASFYSLSVNVFLPLMAGLSVGLVFSKGIIMLSLFPMVAAFFVMVIALAYQFRGWLASLMENKRRRRNIVTIATLMLVLITQLPSLFFWGSRPNRTAEIAARGEIEQLDRSLAERKIDGAEYKRQADAIYQKHGVRRQQNNASSRQDLVRIATTANLVVPAGWLAYGAMGSFQQSLLPALLASLGMGLIGSLSLMRSYRTTVLLYSGHFSGGIQARPALKTRHDDTAGAAAGKSSAAFLEKALPRISEHASAIALAGFRSLMRAPEAKMMLMTPVSFIAVFGLMFLRAGSPPAEFMRPLMATGAITMSLFGLSQLAGNQFGLERAGFRAFVLSPVARRDIWIGKNLALLPFGMGFGIVSSAAIQFVYPMRTEHFFAVLIQAGSMFLVFCVLCNFLSMWAPIALPAGSLRPAKPKGMAILLHLAFMLVFAASMVLTAIPLGIAFLVAPVPIYLALALLEFAILLYLYPRILKVQGILLQNREQKILEIVTKHVE